MRNDGTRDAFLNLEILHSNSPLCTLLALLPPPGMLLFQAPASSDLPASHLIEYWGKLGHQTLAGHSCDIPPVVLEALSSWDVKETVMKRSGGCWVVVEVPTLPRQAQG